MSDDGRSMPHTRGCPTRAEADSLAWELLRDHGTRWAHVQTAGFVATGVAHLFEAHEAALLVAAATLHDIGYSARACQTGFHPLDGALHLRAQGYPNRLASLVAHHSWAVLTAPLEGVDDLCDQFPHERSLLADALVYADMHSAPQGGVISPDRRLADIAARHKHPVQEERADLLRAAIRRVHEELRDPPGPH